MQLISIFVFGIFGAISASFVGLWVARLYTGASIASGRSKCDACGTPLSPLALVPVLSWIITEGRCLTCKAQIGIGSTVAEVLLGTLFVLAYLKLGLTPPLLVLLLALILLLALVLYDLAHSILPPVLLYPFLGVALVFALLSAANVETLLSTLTSALLMGVLFALVHFASRGRALGFADTPLVVGLALIAGTHALTGLLFSFWIGGVVGMVLLAIRATGTTIKSEVPFAPFLASGFLLAYFSTWDAFSIVQYVLGV